MIRTKVIKYLNKTYLRLKTQLRLEPLSSLFGDGWVCWGGAGVGMSKCWILGGDGDVAVHEKNFEEAKLFLSLFQTPNHMMLFVIDIQLFFTKFTLLTTIATGMMPPPSPTTAWNVAQDTFLPFFWPLSPLIHHWHLCLNHHHSFFSTTALFFILPPVFNTTTHFSTPPPIIQHHCPFFNTTARYITPLPVFQHHHPLFTTARFSTPPPVM